MLSPVIIYKGNWFTDQNDKGYMTDKLTTESFDAEERFLLMDGHYSTEGCSPQARVQVVVAMLGDESCETAVRNRTCRHR